MSQAYGHSYHSQFIVLPCYTAAQTRPVPNVALRSVRKGGGTDRESIALSNSVHSQKIRFYWDHKQLAAPLLYAIANNRRFTGPQTVSLHLERSAFILRLLLPVLFLSSTPVSRTLRCFSFRALRSRSPVLLPGVCAPVLRVAVLLPAILLSTNSPHDARCSRSCGAEAAPRVPHGCSISYLPSSAPLCALHPKRLH